jgi:hypothetical protein
LLTETSMLRRLVRIATPNVICRWSDSGAVAVHRSVSHGNWNRIVLWFACRLALWWLLRARLRTRLWAGLQPRRTSPWEACGVHLLLTLLQWPLLRSPGLAIWLSNRHWRTNGLSTRNRRAILGLASREAGHGRLGALIRHLALRVCRHVRRNELRRTALRIHALRIHALWMHALWRRALWVRALWMHALRIHALWIRARRGQILTMHGLHGGATLLLFRLL